MSNTVTDTETVNGHQYVVTRTDGVITNLVACDPVVVAPPPINAKVSALIGVLLTGSATPLQQQRAQALTLALLLGLTDAG